MKDSAKASSSFRLRVGVFTTLVIGGLLVGCASHRSSPLEGIGERARCSYYKVGEVRNVSSADFSRIRRRMDGDFIMTRPESPGARSYAVEVFRYEDRECARRNRR
jgi:hypothetical protein